MGPQTTVRALQREERCHQREAIKRQKELERQAREQAKLSAIEQAELEFRRFENQLDLLISDHKEHGPVWDWPCLAASLAPAMPERLCQHELRARQHACLSSYSQVTASAEEITHAQQLDELDYEEALASYRADVARLEELRPLARRIVAGDLKAYAEALSQLSPLAELSVLGSTIHFTVHDRYLVECVLKVTGPQIIPVEAKSLTAAGKISIKPMPRIRRHELYQDHICSCMLRVARETFALLPVHTLLITASVERTDTSTGHRCDEPVLSAVLPRDSVLCLDFERLDPSDALERFRHRGDFKASRKTGGFASICALSPADLVEARSTPPGSAELIAQARAFRAELRSAFGGIIKNAATVAQSPCSYPASS